MIVKTKKIGNITVELGFQSGEFIIFCGDNFSTGLLVGYTCTDALDVFRKFNLETLHSYNEY